MSNADLFERLADACWSRVTMFDDEAVEEQAARPDDLIQQLLELHPRAVDEVFGFLLARCGDVELAEDLTSEAFMEAVSAIERGILDSVSIGWLVVVARRRLIDHWRRQERQARHLRAIETDVDAHDPWEEHPDVGAVQEALSELAPRYRLVLALRYLDGFSVPEVAKHIGRSVHGAESLLQRARAALRVSYERGGDDAS
jgi:RNA polymerase sigma-70 factor (ECF subfamily)